MSEYFRKPIVKTLMLKGQEGQSIKGIEKTSTDGFVDTYTITLTDGTTSTFTVTNGKGISSIGKTDTRGLVDTYTITFNDGTNSTFTVTNGDDNAYKPAVDALGKRIDNLILSSGTESSAEVVDARTGYDGKAYDTLGTAIRSQVSDLKSDLVDLKSEITFDNSIFVNDGYYNISDKNYNAGGGFSTTDFIEIGNITNIDYYLRGHYQKAYSTHVANVVFFDFNKNVISMAGIEKSADDVQGMYSNHVKVPYGAKYVKFTTATSKINDGYVKGYFSCGKVSLTNERYTNVVASSLTNNILDICNKEYGYCYSYDKCDRGANEKYVNTGIFLADTKARYFTPTVNVNDCHTVFLDKDMNYIRGTLSAIVIPPTDCVYMIMSFPIANEELGIKKESINYISVGSYNCDYTHLVVGLEKAKELNVPLYLYSGEYDLIELGVDVSSGGLKTSVDIIGIGNPIIKANLDTLDSAFSPINIIDTSKSVRIENIEIECSNCRYCIHDEMGSNINYVDGSYNHYYTNLVLKNNTVPSTEWDSPRAIGIGLGNSGSIVISDCITECNKNIPNHTDIDAHSGHSGQTTNSKIIIENCVSKNGTFSVTQFGYSGFVNSGIIRNCLVKYEPLLVVNGSENFELIKYNNVIES